MTYYRVTLVVEMDVTASDADMAYEGVYHEAAKNSDFIVIEGFDPIEIDKEGNPIDTPLIGGTTKEKE